MSRNAKKESAELDVSALPSLPKGWCWATVAGVAKVQGGIQKQPKRKPAKNPCPYLRVANVLRNRLDLSEVYEIELFGNELERLRLLKGDLLVVEGNGSKTEIGRSALWNGAIEPCVHQNHIIRVRFFAGMPEFLNYYWNSAEGNQRVMDEAASTSGLYTLSVAKVCKLPVPVAPLPQQRRIVAKIEELFSDLDAGVAALRRVRANLKRYRAAVLKAAVEGRLTAEWREKNPPKETGPQLLARILAERRRKWEQAQRAAFAKAGKTPPAKWKDKYKQPAPPDCTNLPPLPEGWCWATVDQLICRSEYGTSVKCSYDAGGPPVLRIPNIARGAIDLSDVKFSTKPLELDSENALRHGDLLVCRTNGSIGLLGKAALVREELRSAHSFASYLLRFRLVERETIPGWLHLYLSSQPGRVFIEGHAASSAGQHNISLSLMHRMPIPVPPLSEQREILYLTEDRLALMGRGEAEVEATLKRAARLRQSILRRAFEGKLVAQDPADGTARALLKRIREQAGNQARAKRPTTKRAGRANVILD